MNKKKLVPLVIALGTTALFSTNVLGQNVTDDTTKGKIQYGEGSLVINPNPEDPDNELPGGNFSNRLPSKLNFGYHPLQSITAENWLAKEVRVEADDDYTALVEKYKQASPTVGVLAVEDNRSTDDGWNIKVKQLDKFKTTGSDIRDLGSTILTIDLGAISNNISTDGITANSNSITITPTNTDVDILQADINSGAGLTELALEKFELAIPANIHKKAEVYRADLNWTVGITP